MPIVQIPGDFDPVTFPDDMPLSQIKEIIDTHIIPMGTKSRRAGRAAPGADQAAQTVLGGMTFGFGDEILGGIGGAKEALTGGDFSKGYQRERDYARGEQEAFKEAHPVLAPIAGISGSLAQAPFTAFGAASQGLSKGWQMAKASGIGSLFGGAQGAGEAESIADIPEEAAKGAAISAVAAPVISGVGAAGKTVKNQIAPNFSGSAATDLALQRIGLALVRDQRTGQMAITRLNKLGPEATVADSAGKSTLGLLDTVANQPGRTEDAARRLVRERQVTRDARLDEIPNRMAGGDYRGRDITEMLTETQKSLSAPLYDKVDRMTVKLTPVLNDIAERPVVRDAISMARTNVANDGAAALAAFDEAFAAKGVMPLRYWDDVKKGLDDVINGIKNRTNLGNESKTTLAKATQVKQELVAELDRLTTNPKTKESVYKEARDAFAGPAALKSAIEDGRGALKMSPEEIEEWMFKAAQSEREAFRLGAADAYRQKIGTRAGQSNLLNAPFERNTRMLMKSIFGDERGYRESMATILREGKLRQIESTVGGSPTARRLANQEDVASGVMGDAMDAAKGVATGNVKSMFTSARNLAGRLQTPEVVRDEIGRRLMLRGVPAEETLRATEAIIARMRQGYTESAAISAVLGSNVNF